MSKKNKQKFKKQLKARVLEEMVQTSRNTQTAQTATTAPLVAKNDIPAKFKNEPIIVEVQNLSQIKADLAKTAIIVASFAVIITGAVLADQHYHVLLRFSDSLFKVLHIQ